MPALGQFAPGTYFRPCDQCGASFKVRPSDVRKAKARGGRPPRFCSLPCQHAAYRGPGNPKWRGGTFVSAGYIYEYAPEHPHATQDGYVMQHRLVVERDLGRHLEPAEEVHHRNRVRHDNRLANLGLMPSTSAHRTHHGEWRDEPCAECSAPVRRSAGMRRRGRGICCSRRCGALRGSRAAAAKASA